MACDDLTGAMALGGSLVRAGLSSIVFRDLTQVSTPRPAPVDVEIVNTGTRDLKGLNVHEQLLRADAFLGEPSAWLHRIDSTMRGNIAAIAAVSKSRRAAGGQRSIVLVSPANPAADRTVRNGVLSLGGARLAETEASSDPVWPIRYSGVGKNLFGDREPWENLTHELISEGRAAVVDFVEASFAAGTEIFVCDSHTEDHSDVLAQVVGTLAQRGGLTLLDSGPVISRYVMAASSARTPPPALTDPPRGSGVTVVISGSATHTTQVQLRCLAESERVAVVSLLDDSDSPNVNPDLGSALVQLLHADSPYDVVSLATRPSKVPDHSGGQRLADAIASALHVVCGVLDNRPPAGLIVIGGETCFSFLVAIGAAGITPTGLVQPLVSRGSVFGGALDGVPIVTKGGLAGDDDALVAAVGSLQPQRVTSSSLITNQNFRKG